ncbi:MAG TPA: ribulokinase [Candidatus Limnocylindrales bacterium]|nr:ribulokinase [Candidatus Limnocylindrales bacterium]
MSRARYTIGIDFGTESARAVLVDVADGRELGVEVYVYRNGVIDERLPAPDGDVVLEPDWALQDPTDYLDTFRIAVPRLVRATGVDPADVIGVGIDFTSCTMLPATADGTPLCLLDEYRREPHAWVKLWKHHAAQPEADRINALARERGEPWLPRYGGKISSEWFYPKSLQILDEAPAIYRAAERLIEAADWVVWQLTGVETRNNCTAGYKAIWSKREGFPPPDFFAALDPRFERVVDEKMSREIAFIGQPAGLLTEQAADWTGLRPGTVVAVANVDAHVSVPAATVTEPGTMVLVMGTSICHLVLGREAAIVEGMCGVVEDGIVPGLYGFEAGQSAVGDIFAWFVEHGVPPEYHERARRLGSDVHEVLAEAAGRLRPGESGLLALDWWNGNRSILVDVDLSGVLLGLTLATKPPEIYRALIEGTAFGTRLIVETFEKAGVAVDRLVACGGLPERNPLLMQIYADVTGRPLRIAGSSQTPALGSAMFAAVAAGPERGGYASIEEAALRMARLRDVEYVPTEAHRPVYDELYAEYVRLHDLFGRGGDPAIKTLRRIRREARGETRGAATAAAGPAAAS